MPDLFLWINFLCLFFTVSLFGHGDLHQQIEALSARIEKEANNPDLYLQRGQLYAQHLDYRQAKSDFRKARLLDADLIITDLLMAKVLSETKEPSSALEYANAFLKHQPNNPDGLIIRAGIFQQLKKERTAQRDLELALHHLKNPQPKHYIAIAGAFLRADSTNLEPALYWLNKGQARFGFDIVLKEKELALLIKNKQYERAIRTIDDILEYFPRKEKWLFQKGQICEKAKRPNAALTHYKATLEAIEILPKRIQMTKKILELEAMTIQQIQLLVD